MLQGCNNQRFMFQDCSSYVLVHSVMVTDCTYLRECTIHSFCNSETIPWLHKGKEGEEGVEEGEEGRRRGGTLPGGSPFCQCCCVSGSPSDHTPHTAQVAPTSQVAVDIHTHTMWDIATLEEDSIDIPICHKKVLTFCFGIFRCSRMLGSLEMSLF